MVSMETFMVAKTMQLNARKTAQAYEEHIEELNAVIDRLTTALAMEQCASAGAMAQLAAMEIEHKDSKYLKPTKMKFKDGEPKTLGRCIFEIYFNKKAEEIGLKNPEKYRRD